MNPIGLLAVGQQAILTNCNDLYALEVRTVGGSVWTATAGYRDPLPAAQAALVVDGLNAMSERCVYRAVLVSLGAV